MYVFFTLSNIEITRNQPSMLLYSINIWPAHNSRQKQRETKDYNQNTTNYKAFYGQI